MVFTDGKMWEAEEVLQYVRKVETENKDMIRTLCVGIGDEVRHR
jgi:hypothetical protein